TTLFRAACRLVVHPFSVRVSAAARADTAEPGVRHRNPAPERPMRDQGTALWWALNLTYARRPTRTTRIWWRRGLGQASARARWATTAASASAITSIPCI